VLCDPVEQLIRSLNDDAVVARQIASAEHRKSIVGERRQHIRTVRSAAWSRNRPRRRLAWLLLLILLVLIALVARANAAPDDDSIALAVRYADILTGVDRDDGLDDERAGPGGDVDGPDPEDADAEADAETGDGDAEADSSEADAELAGLAGGADDAEAASFDAGDLEVREQLADGSEAGEGENAEGGERDPGDGGGPTDGNPGQLAMLDAEQAPAGATTGDDASFAAGAAGAEETYESWMHHRSPSRWGRLDLGVSWRRAWHAPMHAPAYRSAEVWLFATWRR
jgi:hypothetical protein